MVRCNGSGGFCLWYGLKDNRDGSTGSMASLLSCVCACVCTT